MAFPANLARRVGVKRAYCRSWVGNSVTVSRPKPSETICTPLRRTPSGIGRSSTSAAPPAASPPVVSTIGHPNTSTGPAPSGAGARPVHQFHLIHRIAPAAAHRLDGLTDHLLLLDLRLTGQIEVHVLH